MASQAQVCRRLLFKKVEVTLVVPARAAESDVPVTFDQYLIERGHLVDERLNIETSGILVCALAES